MIFESPKNVAAKNDVETLICPRRTARVTNRKVDRQPYRRGLTARPSDHPCREIDATHGVSGFGEQHREAPCPAPEIRNPCWRRRKQGHQQRTPRTPHRRISQAMIRSVIEGRRLLLPVVSTIRHLRIVTGAARLPHRSQAHELRATQVSRRRRRDARRRRRAGAAPRDPDRSKALTGSPSPSSCHRGARGVRAGRA